MNSLERCNLLIARAYRDQIEDWDGTPAPLNEIPCDKLEWILRYKYNKKNVSILDFLPFYSRLPLKLFYKLIYSNKKWKTVHPPGVIEAIIFEEFDNNYVQLITKDLDVIKLNSSRFRYPKNEHMRRYQYGIRFMSKTSNLIPKNGMVEIGQDELMREESSMYDYDHTLLKSLGPETQKWVLDFLSKK